MAGTIFINYRRGDSFKDARYLAELIQKHFPRRRVFLDTAGIAGGEHWLRMIQDQVAGSDVMIVLIGNSWLELKDEDGRRRLDNPNDFVRFEIARALARRIPVLPVLLDGARMPRVTQLPDEVMELALRQAVPLRSESFVDDAAAVSRAVKAALAERKKAGLPYWLAAAAVGVALSGGLILGSLSPLPGTRLPEAIGSTAGGSQELAKLKQDRDNLQSDLSKARTAATGAEAKSADLDNKLKDANSETVKTREERDQARATATDAQARGADLDKKLKDANAETAKAREEAQKIRSSLDAGAVLNKRLTDELAKAREERDQARARITEAEARAADLDKKLKDANSETARARGDAQETRSALAAAGKDLADVRAQLNDLRAADRDIDRLFGMATADLTEEVRRTHGIVNGLSGVAVLNVEARSEAERKGLKTGDLIIAANYRAISTRAELQAQVHEVLEYGKSAVGVEVLREGSNRSIFVTLAFGRR